MIPAHAFTGAHGNIYAPPGGSSFSLVHASATDMISGIEFIQQIGLNHCAQCSL